MRKRYLTLVSCCAAAVAIAGCGSSGSSNSGTGAQVGPANPATFSSDLNNLCKQGNAAVAAVGNDPKKQLDVVEQYLPKFKALTATGAQQAIYAKFLANVEAEVAALKANNIVAARAAALKNRAYAKALNAPECAPTA
ncbi:MAG: hypothetical protein ACJ764_07255 [Solirubrobacteraceae bacterium]